MIEFRAGAAKNKFYIPPGFRMGGYDNRESANIGTHDNLYTKSLALDDGKNTLVIITNDLLAVDGEMSAIIRRKIRHQTGIPEYNILVCASHTHSGPDLYKDGFISVALDRAARELRMALTNTILENALVSLEHMQPAGLYFGRSFCSEIAANRIDPALPSDPSINVLRVANEAGETIAVLINCTCHPTVLGADNLLISADFPGVAQRILERHFLDKAVAMFTNGACGNQSTRFTRRSQDFNEVERMGGLLAKSAIEAVDNAVLCGDVELRAVSRKVELPARKLPSMEEAIKNLKEVEKLKDKAIAEGCSEREVRLAFTRCQGAYITVKMIESGQLRKNISGEIQILRIGDVELIGLPVELFVEYGLSIKQKSRSKNPVVIGYANDYLGYVYTPEEAKRGGYEAWASPFAPEAGTVLVEQVLSLEENTY
ncbi:MAG: neutral/alkaline non-lysosomal ceramidase N-terminal domain-containing protein [Tepidanaerobacteraceae bacterium]|jgi:hypothetical protein|nr:neutral/alkaline non-lysosomal ceramidase N-terminal domain-containing protein [Tepidanaerobacteraceae bacterium]